MHWVPQQMLLRQCMKPKFQHLDHSSKKCKCKCYLGNAANNATYRPTEDYFSRGLVITLQECSLMENLRKMKNEIHVVTKGQSSK